MQRYTGTTTGVFTPSLAFVGVVPGPANGRPAIVGTAIVVANTRLRAYQSNCTVARVGFPANETFGSNALCDSVDLPGLSVASHALGFRSSGRSFVAVVNTNTTLSLFEIVSTAVLGGTRVELVLRSTLAIGSTVNDLAFATTTGLLAVSRADGFVQVARVVNGLLTTVTALPAVPLEAIAAAERAALTQLAFSPDGQTLVVTDNSKNERIYAVPLSLTAGWNRTNMFVGSYLGASTAERNAADLVTGNFNDDNLWDIGLIDSVSRNLIVLRQQPPPCATFISSASHGLISDGVPYEELGRRS